MFRNSNCFWWAVRIFVRRRFRGYILIRKSLWGRFPHFLYSERHHTVSYVPIDPRHKECPPPLFPGFVRWGDRVFLSTVHERTGRV